jgi:glycogen phosphorylase
MRILVDEYDLPFNKAWEIVTNVFFYTNHTVLPEALEKWPVPLFEHLLPRHLQIIYDIVRPQPPFIERAILDSLFDPARTHPSCKVDLNSSEMINISDPVFLAVEKKFPGDREKLARMSLIEEGYPKSVRMANLAIIGMFCTFSASDHI